MGQLGSGESGLFSEVLADLSSESLLVSDFLLSFLEDDVVFFFCLSLKCFLIIKRLSSSFEFRVFSRLDSILNGFAKKKINSSDHKKQQQNRNTI